jgi:predicted RND superfamily exporter protein
MNKKILVSAWLVLHVFLIWWTKDLVQQNRETQFFSRAGAASYDAFKSVVKERRVLAVKVEFDGTVDKASYESFQKSYQLLQQKFSGPEYQWLDFTSIYEKKIGSADYDDVMQFARGTSNLLMPLVGPRHTGFLLMLDWSLSDAQVAGLIDGIFKADWAKGTHVYVGGLPYTNYLLNRYAEDIKVTLIPLMFLLAALITLVITKSVKVSALLLLVSAFALVESLAIIQGLYGSLNMITAVIPLMVFVITLTLCFHLYCGMGVGGTFKRAFLVKSMPIGLAILTTAIGFGSNIISEIPAIKQFAVAAFMSVVITGIFAVGAMLLFEKQMLTGGGMNAFFPSRYFTRGLTKVQIALCTVLVLIAAVVAIPRLAVVTDATEYFPAKSGLKEAIKRVETEFLGTPAFEVLIRRLDGAPLQFSDHVKIADLETDLHRTMEHRYKLLSLASLAREANRLYTGFDKFPEQRLTWALLISGLPPSVREAFPSGEVYRLSMMGTTMNYQRFTQEKALIEQVLGRHSDYRFEFNGLNYQLMMAQDSLIKVMLEGFFVTLAIVTLIFITFFRRQFYLYGFFIASLLPTVSGLIAVWALDFSINIATVMTFSIALGMIVDNSYHLTWAIAAKRKFADYYRDTITPIVSSGIILCLSFAMFGFNGFLPIRQVGVLVAIILAVGILCSLFIHQTFVKGSHVYDRE